VEIFFQLLENDTPRNHVNAKMVGHKEEDLVLSGCLKDIGDYNRTIFGVRCSLRFSHLSLDLLTITGCVYTQNVG
jgi:hypothetical protein